MQFTWGTNVWALNGTEEPARPWGISYDQRFSTRVAPAGYHYLNQYYSKVVYAWSWPSATKAMSDNIRDIMASGTFLLECAEGTYSMALMPQTYVCTVSGYGAFALSVTAAEV